MDLLASGGSVFSAARAGMAFHLPVSNGSHTCVGRRVGLIMPCIPPSEAEVNKTTWVRTRKTLPASTMSGASIV